MTISFVGSATGVSSATLPAHNVGDMIVAFCFNNAAAVAPTSPGVGSGWLDGFFASGTACYGKAFFKTSDGSLSTGTFGNTTDIVFGIWRSSTGFISFGGNNATAGTTNTVTFINVPTWKSDNTSWAGAAIGHVNTTTNIDVAPAGMTNRTSASSAAGKIALHDTNGTVASWASTNETITGTASGWVSIVFELRDTPIGAWDNFEFINNTQFTLTNSSRTATGVADDILIIAVERNYDRNSGLLYLEFTLGTFSTSVFIPNIAIIDIAGAIYVAYEPSSGNVFQTGGSVITTIMTAVAGDRIGIAIDLITNKLVWIRKNGGLWNNSGTAVPGVPGVGGIGFATTFSLANPAFPGFYCGTTGNACTINIGAPAGVSFVDQIPSGFVAWSIFAPAGDTLLGEPTRLRFM